MGGRRDDGTEQRRHAAAVRATAGIALIGVPARETLLMGGGSAEVTPPHQVSILDGLTAAHPGALTPAASRSAPPAGQARLHRRPGGRQSRAFGCRWSPRTVS